MAENKKPKEHLSWWYFLAKYVMLFFFKILHPYRIIGRENMPLTGKLLVCSNHVTMGDPIYLGCAIPKRQLHYMAKAELFENKLIGGFLKSLGAFPISRGTGGAQGVPGGYALEDRRTFEPENGYGNAGVQDALYDFACGDRGRGRQAPEGV